MLYDFLKRSTKIKSSTFDFSAEIPHDATYSPIDMIQEKEIQMVLRVAIKHLSPKQMKAYDLIKGTLMTKQKNKKKFMVSLLSLKYYSTSLDCLYVFKFFHLLVKKAFVPGIFLLLFSMPIKAQTIQIEELKVDHLLYPDFRVAYGYPVVGASETSSAQTLIANKQPTFSWELGGTQAATQSAYRVIVSNNRDSVEKGAGDVWDSGKILSGESVNVLYRGKALTTGTGYVWRVKVWDKRGQPSAWSPISEFYTADTLEDYKAAYYPLQKTDELPSRLQKSGDIV